MKSVVALLLLTILLTIVFVFSNAKGDVSVRGYHRKDGTFVAPHHRSDPNKSKFDNWSTKPNVNPHTGQRGYKRAGLFFKRKGAREKK